MYDSRYKRVVSSHTIFPKIRIEILDQLENTLFTITDDLSDNAGSISVSYQSGSVRSCTLNLIDKLGEYIPSSDSKYFWINAKFKIYVGVATKRYYLEDNPLIWSDNYQDLLNYNSTDFYIYDKPNILEEEDIYWFSQGVYVSINPRSNRNFSSSTTTIQGADKFSLLDGQSGYNQLLGSYKIPEGTTFGSAIKEILLLETSTGVIDPIPPYIEPVIMPDGKLLSEQVLPFEIVKAPTEYIGSLITTLCDTFACDVFYDTNGRLTITSGTMDMSYSQEAPIWEFSDNELEYGSSSLTQDTINAINTVKVVSANIKDKIYEHTEVNTNPLSDTNISLIGEKSRYIQNDNCFSLDRCKDFAIYTLNRYSRVQKTFDFESSLLPHLNINKVVTVSDKYYGFEKERFIVQSIEIPLSTSGVMSISTSNIASLPYYNMTVGK